MKRAILAAVVVALLAGCSRSPSLEPTMKPEERLAVLYSGKNPPDDESWQMAASILKVASHKYPGDKPEEIERVVEDRMDKLHADGLMKDENALGVLIEFVNSTAARGKGSFEVEFLEYIADRLRS